ncbi:MAG: hypothetical protein DSZ00_05720 [Gammaproteobacteria bacterium]|nr:MAG: hypothetical protein DSZ00_05720 [Gammaproteobacteria bacterium]
MPEVERAGIPWGWVGFFGVLVLLALLSAAALLKGSRELAETRTPVAAEPVWRIIVHGEVHLLDEAAFKQFQAQLEKSVDGRLSGLLQDSDALIEKKVEALFAPVHAAVPRYADWYYSLTGEYLRYAHALGSGVVGYMEEKLREILFDETGVEQALAELPRQLQPEMVRMLGRAGQGVLADLSAGLRQDQAEKVPLQWELAGEVPMDALVSEELMPSGGLAGRQLFSLGAGAGAGVLVAKGGGALLVKKMVASVAGGKSFQLAAGMAGKLAAKSAAKGGSVLAGAGTGALICTPGGPLALLCGAAAGIATWLAVDLVVLEVDEQLNREELEAEIGQAIQVEEERLKDSLKRLYASWMKERLNRFRERAVAGEGGVPGYRPIDELPGAEINAGEAGAEAEAPPSEPSPPR